jgi:hypothetical protein
MATKNNIVEFFELDQIDDVPNVGGKIDIRVE